MNKAVLSRRISRIQSDIEKLSNTLCAMDKTDIETYPENYEMLSTDAALRSELITCKVRHLIYSSTGLKKRNTSRRRESSRVSVLPARTTFWK